MESLGARYTLFPIAPQEQTLYQLYKKAVASFWTVEEIEFAKDKGIPVNVIGTKPAKENSYARFSVSDMPGNYYEPNFEELSEKMRFSYEFYEEIKKTSIKESEEIRKNFDWSNIGKIGYEACLNFYEKINSKEYIDSLGKNSVIVNYLEGPKVEIKGNKLREYLVEFLRIVDHLHVLD